MRRFAIALGLAIFALTALITYRFGVPENGAELLPPKVSIFDTTLIDLDKRPQRLDQWRGKVLVVNYWATWCQPCREEMPGFSRLHDKYADKGVQFIGISIDTADKIIEFTKTTPVSYPLLIGDMGVMESSAAFGNTRQALPYTVVFDRKGELFSSKLGRVAEAELERQLGELISR